MAVMKLRLMLLHKPWVFYTASFSVVHVYSTGCLPVLLIPRVSSLLCSVES